MNYEEINELLDQAFAQTRIHYNFKESERIFAIVLENISSSENLPGLGELQAQALVGMGAALYRQNRADEAFDYFTSGLLAAKESKSRDTEAKAYAGFGQFYGSRNEFLLSIENTNRAIAIYEELGDQGGIARNLSNIGKVYASISDYHRALECTTRALTILEATDDIMSTVITMQSLSGLYSLLNLYDKALEYALNALALCEKHNVNSNLQSGIIGNIGVSYYYLGKYDKAMEFYSRALALSIDLGLKGQIAQNTVNIGLVYKDTGLYDNALEYYGKALALHEDSGTMNSSSFILGSIGELYADKKYEGYDPVKGEEYLLKSIAQSQDFGRRKYTYRFCLFLSDLYKSENRWEEAYHYKSKHHEIKDEVQNEELIQQAQNYDIDRALSNERAEADATKRLLHKTLPQSIADRVIKGETHIADYFESASVLFADVVGFTKISSKMPPAAVLGFMNFIFEHFDSIAAKYGCERIKTIGDGYMAVCGAPITYPDHCERLARMALEMMEDIKLPEDIRKHLPDGTLFHLRIGLHCGEITAGLIGTGKLAYDIYGDAVNIASRMESHGEPGKIHVSDEFMNTLVVGNDLELSLPSTMTSMSPMSPISPISPMSLQFTERGEIEIKGKGMMRTYFLEQV
ncbi:MAG: tetratricopeptide repeat protein [Ignavibacteria bacterium]|nr:tetratricopeptide repeat protein [Ignavibacteria bacterium]